MHLLPAPAALAAITLLATAAAPLTAVAADPAAGLALAQRWCANCHVVGTGVPGTDTAPAFPSLALRHGGDVDWVRAWLSTAHPRMPDLHLSRQEIDDVIAYLRSLPH